jgi:DNA-damage-inducible protein J
MATEVVRARIDPKIKREAAATLKEIGITPSDLFRMAMIRVAVEKKLPFEPLVPNETTAAAMKAARGGRVKKHASTAALLADLNDADD